jgi:MFS superfamily sulfate permease-like transporter
LEHAINRPLIHADTPVVSDAAPVKFDFPLYHTPNVNLTGKSFAHVFGITFSLAAVGLIESVLTLQCVDEILDDTSDATGRFTQECIAQGIANTMSGMFKAMGGDAMIGQSQINVKSGGVGRLSTAFASIMFLIFIVAASKVIELIPLAALTGVLFMIVIYTFDWTCLPLMSGDLKGLIIGRKEDGTREDYAGRRLRKFWFDTNDRIRWKDSAIIILVTVVTERTNLAIAVGVGVVVACLFYAWDNSTGSLRVIRREEEIFGCEKSTTRVAYEVYGELFFGTDREFTNSFRMGPDPRDVVIYMDKCKIKDYSSLAALNSLYVRYADVGKTIRVHNTDPDNRALMDLLGEKFLPQVIDEDLSVSGVSHVVLELAHAKRKASVEKFEDS